MKSFYIFYLIAHCFIVPNTGSIGTGKYAISVYFIK